MMPSRSHGRFSSSPSSRRRALGSSRAAITCRIVLASALRKLVVKAAATRMPTGERVDAEPDKLRDSDHLLQARLQNVTAEVTQTVLWPVSWSFQDRRRFR